MKRANPADLRRAVDVAHTYLKTGILFVPMLPSAKPIMML